MSLHLLLLFALAFDVQAQKKTTLYEVVCESEPQTVDGESSLQTIRHKKVSSTIWVPHREGFHNGLEFSNQVIDENHVVYIQVNIAPKVILWGKEETVITVQTELHRTDQDGSFDIIGKSGVGQSVRIGRREHDQYFDDGKIKSRAHLENLEWLTLYRNQRPRPDGMLRWVTTECVWTGFKKKRASH